MEPSWRAVASYADHTAASVVAGLLESAGIATRVSPDAAIPGLNAPCQLLVPLALADRALEILGGRPPTEAELDVLAASTPPVDE